MTTDMRRETCMVCGMLLGNQPSYITTLVVEKGIAVGANHVIHTRRQRVVTHERCSPRMSIEWARLQTLTRKQGGER